MAEANGQEKTEQPTSKRRNDARKEGNLFQSKDAVTVIMLFGVFYMVKLTLPQIYETARECMIRFFSAIGQENSIYSSPNIYVYMVVSVLKCALPLLLMSMLLGIISHGVQTKFNITFKIMQLYGIFGIGLSRCILNSASLIPSMGLKRCSALKSWLI